MVCPLRAAVGLCRQCSREWGTVAQEQPGSALPKVGLVHGSRAPAAGQGGSIPGAGRVIRRVQDVLPEVDICCGLVRGKHAGDEI